MHKMFILLLFSNLLEKIKEYDFLKLKLKTQTSSRLNLFVVRINIFISDLIYKPQNSLIFRDI